MFEKANYIGLLLYAVDAQENKVGTWELSSTQPTRFFTPPDPLCGGVAVMHTDATPKGYLHEFVFRAPPAGLGPITFRALLKQGDTNGGAFYWPTAPASASKTLSPVDGAPGGDLTLSETPPPFAAQTWFGATAAGQSCDDVCAANGALLVCDLAALEAVSDDPIAVHAATKRFFSESMPAVSRCSSSSPVLTDTSERWLFFHKTSNSSNTCQRSEIGVPSCSAVPTEGEFL